MLSFTYVYQGMHGQVFAESVAQAVDRIKVAYLAKQGIRPNDSRFRVMKTKITEPWRLNFAPETNIKFRSVYRSLKDGDFLSHADKDFYTKYDKAVKDLNSICPSHLRPIGVTT